MPEPHPTPYAPARRRHIAAASLAALACAVSVAPALAQQSAEEPPPTATSEEGATGATGATGSTGASGPTGGEESAPAPGAEVRLTRSQLKRLQRKLRVRADGTLGSRTRAAIARWERRAGLPVDGVPDRDVLRRMRIRLTRAQAMRPAEPSAGSERSVPAGTDRGAVRRAVDAALAQEGTPYRSGGEQPGGFDCSGLTSWAFAKAGIDLPRTSFAQFRVGEAVQRDDLQAGDLVFFDSAGPGASDVAIATSAKKVVSATTHGVVEHATFDAYWGGHYVGARRVSTP